MPRSSPFLILVVAGLLLVPPALHAQRPPDIRRVQATRTELEADLQEIDRILESPGYSSRLRDAKRREGEMIRERLDRGDFQVGDQVVMYVENEPTLTDTFSVQPGQVLALPGLPDITMEGLLRSEADAHLSRELARYIRNPTVRVQAMIRLSFGGQIGRPGFYQLPADMQVSEAIMAAGGPVSASDPNRSVVRRLGREIVTQEQFPEILAQGTTLDQLNLRAGDQIIVDQQRTSGLQFRDVLVVAGLLTSTFYLVTRIF